MNELVCKVAQQGFCAGKLVVLYEQSDVSFELSDNIEAEKEMLFENIEKLKLQLKSRADESLSENAAMLEADIVILEDDEFSGAILDVLNSKKVKLSYAVQEGSRALADKLEKNNSEYISQRAADIRGLGKMLVDEIESRKKECIAEPCIVAAEEMTPERFSFFDREKLLGLVTVKGATSSHVSIMAGNMGIPYVYDIKSLSDLKDSAYVIIDSDNERIITDPDEKMKASALEKVVNLNKEREKAAEASKNINLNTKIFVNISDISDLDNFKKCSADGVGLFRSEFLYMNKDCAPDEETQYAAYTEALKAARGKDVVVRTMDIGSDKLPSWLDMPEEKNPALGTRGIRFALKRPEMMKTQLRAMLRAACTGNMKIMFPMITSEWEVDALKKEVELTAKELERDGIAYRIPPIGIMIETPAAAIIADRLAKKVDFFSIGTNDLTQYTIALDREAQGLEMFYQPHHEALVRLIGSICDSAHKEGITAAMCGELASDPEIIPKLIEAGIDELSVAPSKVNDVRILAASAEKELFTDILCPCDGQVIPMEQIEDPVFSEGILGQGLGIIPCDSTVYAPVEGKLINLSATRHAFTIEKKDGRQILVHVGIDTVKLKGKYFEALAKEGDDVCCGQEILKVNFKKITEEGYDPTVIVVSLNK